MSFTTYSKISPQLGGLIFLGFLARKSKLKIPKSILVKIEKGYPIKRIAFFIAIYQYRFPYLNRYSYNLHQTDTPAAPPKKIPVPVSD